MVFQGILIFKSEFRTAEAVYLMLKQKMIRRKIEMNKCSCSTGRLWIVMLTLGAMLMLGAPGSHAADNQEQETVTKKETDNYKKKKKKQDQEEVQKLEDMRVTEKGGAPGLEQNPSVTVITVDEYDIVDAPGNIEDLLKSQAIIDFEGQVDLVPDEDTLTMRGFDSNRFVAALDGLTIQKTGGRKGSHIVDYSLLSSAPIEKIEIIAGPHSALYDSKSIGGAVNITTGAPRPRDTLRPGISVTSSYSSYNTWNNNLSVNGNVNKFSYGLGMQKNSTDGYLRNTATDISTYSGEAGVILPYDGFANLRISYSDIDREVPVNNDEEDEDYDPNDPSVVDSSWEGYERPTWDKKAHSYRLNYMQNLPVGKVTVGAYKSMEDRDRAYSRWVDNNDHSLGLERVTWVTTWRQEGAKIQDVYQWNVEHTSTFGYDTARLFDGEDEDKRVQKAAFYLQHHWDITDALSINVGLRQEDVQIWVSNSGIPDRGNWIHRNWDELVPKTYTTYKMDDLASFLRDTSLSLGISKIWHAPDSHGYYNPQGRPTGAWLNPEHGIGYDLVLNRRLWGDVSLMLDYSFYKIEDYMAHNSSYAEYSGSSAGSLRYSDYMLNLEEMQRHGLDVTAGGHLTTDLSFNLTYAWQDFENQGNEPCGKQAVDEKPKHTFRTGLQYALFEDTRLMLDYYYQSERTVEESEQIGVDEDEEPIYIWRQVDNPSYQLVNVAVTQNLFKNRYNIKDARLKLYIKNLFDENYNNSRGYPSTDRTFGVTLTLKL